MITGGTGGNLDGARHGRNVRPLPYPMRGGGTGGGTGGRAATSAGDMITGGNRKARPARQRAGHRAARHGTATGARHVRPPATDGNGRQRAATGRRNGQQWPATGGELDSGGGECSKFFEPRILGRPLMISES